jgi:hypothetical protein
MPNAANAKIEFEGAQQSYPMSALTDSGDQTIFTSSASLFSRVSGFAPAVRPDGVRTGGNVTPDDAEANDTVDVSAGTAYVAGVAVSFNAASPTITRPATAVSKVNSIVVSSAGVVSAVAGTDGSDANFVETRGAAGGPPYIPTDSIELAQVRVTSDTAAPIAATEMFTAVGTHRERYDYPLWDEVDQDGEVHFKSALPQIHTGDVTKNVYASYADPIFTELGQGVDFTPPENTWSVNSTPIYGGTLGEASQALSQGSFTAYLTDGVTDPIMKVKDQNAWIRFYPDKYATPHILCQGYLGMSRAYPAGGNINADVTIAASGAAVSVEA